MPTVEHWAVRARGEHRTTVKLEGTHGSGKRAQPRKRFPGAGQRSSRERQRALSRGVLKKLPARSPTASVWRSSLTRQDIHRLTPVSSASAHASRPAALLILSVS